MPLLKICGLTNIADFRHAQHCGADFLGVIVEIPTSPRSLSLQQAAVLARLGRSQLVAVVRGKHAAELQHVIALLEPRALQIHDIEADDLRAFRNIGKKTELWLAVSLPPHAIEKEAVIARALAQIKEAHTAGASMIVLDTAIKGASGGTGQPCDWEAAAAIAQESPLPVLLAGGICPANAAEALARVRPAGLDASSRVEIVPGRKDPVAVRALAQIVKSAAPPLGEGKNCPSF